MATPGLESAEQNADPSAKSSRLRTGIIAGVWLLVIASALFMLTAYNSWWRDHFSFDPEHTVTVEQDAATLTLAVVAGVIALVVFIAAIPVRRWVALVLAGVVGLLSLFIAYQIVKDNPELRPGRSTVKYTLNPSYCACYSGSPCDCPGG